MLQIIYTFFVYIFNMFVYDLPNIIILLISNWSDITTRLPGFDDPRLYYWPLWILFVCLYPDQNIHTYVWTQYFTSKSIQEKKIITWVFRRTLNSKTDCFPSLSPLLNFRYIFITFLFVGMTFDGIFQGIKQFSDKSFLLDRLFLFFFLVIILKYQWMIEEH